MIKDTRDLIQEEMVFNMFPITEMDTLDNEIEQEQFSVHDYISSHLQQMFLPWPLSTLNLLLDLVILSGLIIIGLILLKVFIDPCMSICHLLRGSSLTITEKISSAVIPATTVTRVNRKGQLDLEEGIHIKEKVLEARITELEKRVNIFQTMFIKEQTRNDGSIRCLEN